VRGHLLAICVFAVLPAAARGQAPAAFADLIPDLAARIAAAAAPLTRVQIVFRSPRIEAGSATDPLDQDLARQLSGRGVAIVDRPEGAAIVTYTCSETVRSRVCAAHVENGTARYSVVAERPRGPSAAQPAGPIVLTLTPLFAQAARILDLAIQGPRVVVLDSTGVSVQERRSGEWRAVSSRPVSTSVPWPRDLRGRLRLDGAGLEVFLPGTTCRGTIEPLSIECADGQRAWPIGVENSGIGPGRNVFDDRDAAGRTFFSAAALGPEAGARLLTVGLAGTSFVDAGGRIVAANDRAIAASDEVASLTTSCAEGTHILVSSRDQTSPDRVDTLRVLTLRRMEATTVAPPVLLPGAVTTIWPSPDPRTALVVTRHAVSGTYEAFHASLACSR
jgi:hypothetical protein